MSKTWIVVFILTILLFGGTGYLYIQRPPQETPGVFISPQGQASSAISGETPVNLVTRDITLLVGDPAQGRLVKKSVKVQDQPDIIQEMTQAIQSLIHPEPEMRNVVIPDGTELLNVFMTSAGTVYLNLNRNLQDRHIGGLSAELATITALVNTVFLNFQEAKQVQILVEGAEIETLAGHIDCRKPFSKMLGSQNL